jgi:hypothetical protein
MLSRGEVAIIEAEIERLEKALSESTDSGIRDRIKAWIKEEKRSWSGKIQNSKRDGSAKSVQFCSDTRHLFLQIFPATGKDRLKTERCLTKH